MMLKDEIMKHPFNEYYFIGKPGDRDTIDYYFYKPEYSPDNWEQLNIPNDEVILFSGRWRFQSPRREYNEEMSALDEMYIVHKDATNEDIENVYGCSHDISKAIIKVIEIHKNKKYELDYLVDLMWQKLGIEEKTIVTKKEE